MPSITTRLTTLQPWLLVAVLTLLLPVPAGAANQDTDRDGIPDQQESFWGTDPATPDLPALFYTFPERSAADLARPGYDPALDPRELAVTHIAEDRYLWRATFAADPDPAKLVLHLYLDSDDNLNTGRTGGGPTNGTDHMVSIAAGIPRLQVYPPDGTSPAPGTPPYHYVSGRHIYVLADTPLKLQDGQGTGTLYVLCHGLNGPDGKPSPMNTSSGSKRFQLPPIAQRPGAKITRLTDRQSLEGFDRSYGIDAIREQLFGNKGVVFAGYDQLDLDGFEINLFTQAHFGHLKSTRPLGRAGVAAPKGRFHPAS
ncbi:MAG: hypothetical protein PHC30_02435 [Lentisphaeria bacterium]|nr:hypothetical protein [Lentisphaeria bacterium]